jgi:hypothetical protein
MPAFPIHDWEFWVASAIALFAAAYLLRGALPIPFLSARFKRRKRERRVTLTIEGQRPAAEIDQRDGRRPPNA